MLEKLEQVDTSSLSELRSLKKRRTIIEKRIELMEKKSDSVSLKVLERVRQDYENQLNELDASAQPLVQKVGVEYRKLVRIIKDLNATLEEISLDKEEITLRKELGEFNEKEFKAKLDEYSGRLEHFNSALGEASQLQEQFVECVRSEDDLLGQEPNSVSVVTKNAPIDDRLTAEARGDDPTARQTQNDPNTTTRLVTMPRLVRITSDESVESFNLTMTGTGTSIGRDASNHICLEAETISRNHARIGLEQEGFVIYDHTSENGVFVNGIRVEKQLLEEGDHIAFGSNGFEFVFRLG